MVLRVTLTLTGGTSAAGVLPSREDQSPATSADNWFRAVAQAVCRSTACWSLWCTGATGSPMTCWPAGSGYPARRSPERSARCARCWPSAAAPSKRGSGFAPWPMWSPTWAPAGSSACWMPPRCGCAARRPHKAGRHRFVSGKARANTVQALVITDAAGGLSGCLCKCLTGSWCQARSRRPGNMMSNWLSAVFQATLPRPASSRVTVRPTSLQPR
jgi:hypothetical protein